MPRKKKTEDVNAVESVTDEAVTVESTKKTSKKKKDENVTDAPVEKNETVAADVQSEKSEKPKRKRKPKAEIDEELRDTRILLKGARSKLTILKGMIERVDVADNAPTPESAVYAVLHYGKFKVMIPALQMGLHYDETLPSQEKASVLRKALNTMLGANIEYCVTHVSESEPVAAGNRLVAMRIKRKKYFKNKYRNTGKTYVEYAKENAIPVEGDIVAVSGSQIRLCVLGAETKVMAKDASWKFTSNLSESFFPGDTTKVIIKDIKHDEDNDDYILYGSIKELTPNMQVKNIADYSRDSTCLGRVTGTTERGYFLSIGDDKTGIEARCDLVYGGITPQVNDIVSCQLININYETGDAKAKITRIIRHAKS